MDLFGQLNAHLNSGDVLRKSSYIPSKLITRGTPQGSLVSPV